MSASEECHECPYREQVVALQAELATLRAELDTVGDLRGQLDELKRHVFGQRSERMPSVADELRSRGKQGVPADPAVIQQKRRENKVRREGVVEERVEYSVPVEDRVCPRCGGTQFTKLGQGKATTVYDYVPGHMVKRVIVQETLACRCGECVLTAPAPAKVVEQGKYGAGFMAHIVVRKCGDQNPVYRLEKDFKRLGIPMARSTMNDLFHSSADKLRRLWTRNLELVAASDVVFADETPVKVQAKKKCRRGFVWTFIAQTEPTRKDSPTLVSFRFSESRSGETPKQVLGGSKGTLVVDGYTGYNNVVDPEGRIRSGCLAHARRKFFDALPSAPKAREALDLILEVYGVEREAAQQGIARTDRHAELRTQRSRPAMEKLRQWLEHEQGLAPPKSRLGKAIAYAVNNWEHLTVFLSDPCLPPDNNISERHLRPIAVGRKNWMFLGNAEAGENFCGLQSLVSTCEANGVNPLAYLTDVLARIDDHPARKLDDLLPHRWAPISAD